MQDRVHLFVAPHRSPRDSSNLDLERKHALERAEKGLSHVSEPINIIISRLRFAKQLVPVQPLVDGHAGLGDGIGNAGGHSTRGVVRFQFLVGQAIKEVWEGEHELLDVASVDDGGLLLSLLAWRAKDLKDSHN